MNKVLSFPNDQRAREQAGAWLARLDRGLTEAERIELQQWLQENERHRTLVLEMSALWDRMDVLKEIASLFPLPPERVVWWRFRPLRLTLASFAVLGLALVLWAAVPQWFFGRQTATLRQAFHTGVGEQRHIDLPDGSIVTLNTTTELRVDYTEAARRIELEHGEAHFKVAKDSARMFIVRAGEHEFKAVGTAFNVRMSPEGVALTVSEGKVRVLVAAEWTDGGRRERASPVPVPTEITVDAGKEVSLTQTMQVVEPLPPPQLDAVMAWTRGMIVFDRTPLAEAIHEVSRYSTARFAVADDIKTIPVTGYFRVGDIDALVTSLEKNFDIDVHRDEGSITLSARRQ